MGSRAGLEILEKRKSFDRAGIRTPKRTARSEVHIYRLHLSGSIYCQDKN